MTAIEYPKHVNFALSCQMQDFYMIINIADMFGIYTFANECNVKGIAFTSQGKKAA